MKRTKLMLGVAALSAALLGTGYAAMTDVLTIGSTVNTANFDVDFENSNLTVGGINHTQTSEIEKKFEATDVEMNDKVEDQVTIKVNRLKPGVPVVFTTTMTNKSNIDAKLANLTLSTGKADSSLNDLVTVTLQVGDTKIEGKFNEFITTNFTEQVKNIVLQETGKEGNAVNVSLKLELGEVPANSDIYAVSSALDYTLSFDWQQTTAAE